MLRKQILLLGNKKMILPQLKNTFASQTQTLLPKHKFPSPATMKTMRLTSFQGRSLTMAPSNDERTSMADDEAEAEELQTAHREGKGKRERNWKDEEIDLLITLFEDKDC